MTILWRLNATVFNQYIQSFIQLMNLYLNISQQRTNHKRDKTLWNSRAQFICFLFSSYPQDCPGCHANMTHFRFGKFRFVFKQQKSSLEMFWIRIPINMIFKIAYEALSPHIATTCKSQSLKRDIPLWNSRAQFVCFWLSLYPQYGADFHANMTHFRFGTFRFCF